MDGLEKGCLPGELGEHDSEDEYTPISYSWAAACPPPIMLPDGGRMRTSIANGLRQGSGAREGGHAALVLRDGVRKDLPLVEPWFSTCDARSSPGPMETGWW